MNPETRAASLQMLMSKEHGGAAAVARDLKDAGMVKQVLHKATIIRNAVAEAKDQGFRVKAAKGKPVKMLTESTKEARPYTQLCKGCSEVLQQKQGLISLCAGWLASQQPRSLFD